MDKIKVLVADDILETRKVICKMIDMEEEKISIVGEASNGKEVLELIPKVKPDVVLMDINMPILNGLEATEMISKQFPKVTVIIMSVQGENEYLKKAMFCGAKEYIVKPFNFEMLINTIVATYNKNKERYINIENKKEKNRTAEIISFFSSKGGVGKSILSLNAAVIASKDLNKKTLLWDLDLQFGDIGIMINKYNHKNVWDIVDEGQLQDYDTVKPYLYNFNKNLDILFAPLKPDKAEYIGKDILQKLIEIFKNKYDLIYIDTGVNFNDGTLYALDAADKIYYVSTMEIVSFKNTKLGLSVMKSLGYNNEKVKLIINKFNTNYGISKKDIEEVFQDKKSVIIPQDDKIVNISINSGIPFCNENKYYKSKLVKSMKEIFG
ncbi:MAG: response regulator [Clostridiaceae bacterium]